MIYASFAVALLALAGVTLVQKRQIDDLYGQIDLLRITKLTLDHPYTYSKEIMNYDSLYATYTVSFHQVRNVKPENSWNPHRKPKGD